MVLLIDRRLALLHEHVLFWRYDDKCGLLVVNGTALGSGRLRRRSHLLPHQHRILRKVLLVLDKLLILGIITFLSFLYHLGLRFWWWVALVRIRNLNVKMPLLRVSSFLKIWTVYDYFAIVLGIWFVRYGVTGLIGRCIPLLFANILNHGVEFGGSEDSGYLRRVFGAHGRFYGDLFLLLFQYFGRPVCWLFLVSHDLKET